MNTSYRRARAGLLAGAAALAMSACTAGRNIGGRDISGPVVAPTGPVGSSGSGNTAAGGGSNLPPPPPRNPSGSGQ